MIGLGRIIRPKLTFSHHLLDFSILTLTFFYINYCSHTHTILDSLYTEVQVILLKDA